MSITFAPAPEIMRYHITCYCGRSFGKQTFPSFDVAYRVMTDTIPFEHPPRCVEDEYCAFSQRLRVRAVDEERLCVNMNNGNSARIMKMLGIYSSEPVGELDGQEFLNRVQAKLDEFPDVVAERSDAYEMQNRLSRLASVASYAAAHNSTVVWN